VRAVVTDNQDLTTQGRVQLRIPTMPGLEPWAAVCAPFAGDGHGMVMLPAVGSGVWIEFEAGNIDNPIWTGGWWASGQRPAPEGATVRIIVSEHGHKLIFDDDADEVKIVHGTGLSPTITLTGTDITLTCGACEIKLTNESISLNNGQIKVGPAGVSLVQGAMSFGVAP